MTLAHRPDSARRRRTVVLAGHTGDERTARAGLGDPDPSVRSAALGALARLDALDTATLVAACADPDPGVRRRAAELGAGRPDTPYLALLADPDDSVVETAAFAAGELGDPHGDGPDEGNGARFDPVLVDRLAELATGHHDPLVREACVAALGALGDDRGLPAILAATADRATVRRRAVIALAPFAGTEVDAAIDRALGDRDWQVRQAAEDQRAARRAGDQ